MTVFSWAKLVDTVTDAFYEDERICHATKQLSLREDISTDPNKNAFSMGDLRLKKHQQTLDMFRMDTGGYVERSQQQKYFHHWFTQAILPHFYGKQDWCLQAQRVLANFTYDDDKEERIEKVSPEVLVVTPRRYGKTWAIAMFVASILLNIPGIKVAVFSTGHRASNWLMRKVAKFINDIEGGGARICRQNQEELFVSPVALTKGKSANSSEAKARQTMEGTSEFYSFPSSVNSKFFIFIYFFLFKRASQKTINMWIFPR